MAMPFAETTRLFFAEATPYLVCVAALAFAASIVALWRTRRRAQKRESEFWRLPMLQKLAACLVVGLFTLWGGAKPGDGDRGDGTE